jgi:hypothetical protein
MRVKQTLPEDLHSSAIFAFRIRLIWRIKLIRYNGMGLCVVTT